MFNKRHYEAIALVIQDLPLSNDEHDEEGLCEIEALRNTIAHEFAAMFRRDNSRFQPERFIAACQPRANVKLRTRYKVVDIPRKI